MQASNAELIIIPLAAGLLYTFDDGNHVTQVHGFVPDQLTPVALPEGYTHLGFVVSGNATLAYGQTVRTLNQGDYFSVIGPAQIQGEALGLVSSARDYTGFNLLGGPLEAVGRLRYVSGCSDTLLVPPVRKGDPCLNHLHFPAQTEQVPHTHPSVRVNLVYKGEGVCMVPDDPRQEVSLVPGHAFIMPTGMLHSFDTRGHSMDIITFHPDSDFGPTDDDHPMVNRTIVGGVSASHLPELRTEEIRE